MIERKSYTLYQSNEKRLLSSIELSSYLGLGRCSSTDFATKIKARVKIGRRVLYDKTVIDKYLDSLI